MSFKRLPDKLKLYECDYPDCFKFFDTIDTMYKHKTYIHNQQVYLNQNLELRINNPLMYNSLQTPMNNQMNTNIKVNPVITQDNSQQSQVINENSEPINTNSMQVDYQRNEMINEESNNNYKVDQ